MKRFQLENLYKINGVEDFRLRNTDDLLKIHGINFKNVDGYNRLDDLNRAIYENFIIRFLNGLGLESRALLIPTGIYWVEDIEKSIKDPNEKDEIYLTTQRIIHSIDRTGVKSALHAWIDEEYSHIEPVEIHTQNYLRFEYEHGTYEDGETRKEWLHVKDEGNQWY